MWLKPLLSKRRRRKIPLHHGSCTYAMALEGNVGPCFLMISIIIRPTTRVSFGGAAQRNHRNAPPSGWTGFYLWGL